ncbi:MAG: ActS/PrrB/RegB family redox-sensitive histidine kinase [Hyphomonadaceae bacterium]|nr:ActS/PrrB/RegB family redox-sensitive histidine kinase [Hyphomonadaceae bacterium]
MQDDKRPSEPATPEESIWRASGRMRLETLILVRWIAIAGQTAGVLFVEFVLKLDLALAPTLGIISLSAWVNIFLMISRPAQQGPVREWEAAAQLAYDLLQLAALLGLTGGAQNPFLLLFIAPVAVAATAMRPAVTAALACFAIVCVVALLFLRSPLPWLEGAPLDLPQLYEFGMATAVVTGLAFTGVYAWRVAAEEERAKLALAAAEAVLAREQRVSALGALAAAAAHELGTPLATMHLVAKEMARELPQDSPMSEDVQLLVSQAERCRAILQQLGREPNADPMMARASLRALMEETADAHRGLGRDIVISLSGPDGEAPPDVRRLPEVLHGLGALVENAIGFSEKEVEIAARWDANQIVIAVRDDGPGFPADILRRLGAPYLSARGAIRRGRVGGGLGLGFFIAKTLLERSGAELETRNRKPPRTGAVVRVVWPRAALEAASDAETFK